MDKVIIRNLRNNSKSEMDAALWDQIKTSRDWRGVFELIQTIKEPPEVAELRARLEAEKRSQ